MSTDPNFFSAHRQSADEKSCAAPDGIYHTGLSRVLEQFEALIQHLDALAAGHSHAASLPEVTSRLDRAKSLACRGAEIVRRQIETKPD